MFDENSNGVLDIKEIGKLNAAIFNLFPRLGYKGKEQPGNYLLIQNKDRLYTLSL
jgi:hypothetical protein